MYYAKVSFKVLGGTRVLGVSLILICSKQLKDMYSLSMQIYEIYLCMLKIYTIIIDSNQHLHRYTAHVLHSEQLNMIRKLPQKW